MKIADLIISRIFTIIAVLLIGYLLIFHLSITMKSVCFVLIFLYLIFMLCHMVLLFPIIGILGISDEIIKDIKSAICNKIKENLNINILLGTGTLFDNAESAVQLM